MTVTHVHTMNILKVPYNSFEERSITTTHVFPAAVHNPDAKERHSGSLYSI